MNASVLNRRIRVFIGRFGSRGLETGCPRREMDRVLGVLLDGATPVVPGAVAGGLAEQACPSRVDS